jgi:hypothetical protein
MFITFEIGQSAKEAVEAEGHDYDDFLSYVANVWNGGAFQDLPDSELEDGQHYRNAAEAIESRDGSDLLNDWIKNGEKI